MSKQALKARTAISPTRQEDYPEWYQQVIKAADLAESSPVRGCMVIKPWGYAIWENMVAELDQRIKATGHKNAYFPLFIPISFLQKEAQHVEGFAKECAVVTHHRLESNAKGELVPAGPLEEPLIVRPTSETIIGTMFAQWIQSYRDLPLLINQWANVVRWEMRTRLFLRTSEFLWQEGHTAHASREEAVEETLLMLNTYVEFVQNVLAIPVVRGEKTESERFPGAVNTYTFEAMMQDKKALQGGTSHFLGQNFSRAFDITYRAQNGDNCLAWTTSWGVTTRLVGCLVMVHSDDDGCVLPPKIAPTHIVIIPVLREETSERVMAAAEQLAKELRERPYHKGHLVVEIDKRDMGGGEKRWDWVKHGMPIQVEIGIRDLEKGTVMVRVRDAMQQAREIERQEFITTAPKILEELQQRLFDKALAFRNEHMRIIDSKEEFYAFFTPQNSEKPEIHGGFALAHWCGDPAIERQVKDDLNVTIRCIPMDLSKESGTCIFTGKPSAQRVVFAKSY
ncbi:MAG: proline--tRNA ligase [Chlamydiia bacterium]